MAIIKYTYNNNLNTIDTANVYYINNINKYNYSISFINSNTYNYTNNILNTNYNTTVYVHITNEGNSFE